MTTPLSASNAYTSALRTLSQDAGKTKTNDPSTNEFAELVANTVQATTDTAKRSEAVVGQVANGPTNANMVEVVTAVAETELALQTMVSVRDRVISAYQEIMRMPI